MKKCLLIFLLLIVSLFCWIEPSFEGYRRSELGYAKVVMTNATSEWVLVPYNTASISLSLDFAVSMNTNYAKFEYTIIPITQSAYSSISNFFNWTPGIVTNDIISSLSVPAWGVRLVSISNAVTGYFLFWLRK